MQGKGFEQPSYQVEPLLYIFIYTFTSGSFLQKSGLDSIATYIYIV
jgi:hypothetical protein